MHGKTIMGCLSDKILELLCTAAEALLSAEPLLLELSAPMVIVGNLYSHFHDLQRILRSNGLPPQRKYLFLGNAVTHGAEGIETLSLLLALKLRYPQHVFLVRGQSESRDAARVHGFYEQCKQRVGLRQWRRFATLFAAMPLAATVDQRVLCAAGGIGPSHLSVAASSLPSLQAQLLGGAAVSRPGMDLPEAGAVRELLAGPTEQPAAAAVHSLLLQPHGLQLLVTGGRATDHGFRIVNAHHVAVFSATEAVDEDGPAAVLLLSETRPQVRFTVERFNPQPRVAPEVPSLRLLAARASLAVSASARAATLPVDLLELLGSVEVVRTCAAACCARSMFLHEPLRTPEETDVCSVRCYATRWQQKPDTTSDASTRSSLS